MNADIAESLIAGQKIQYWDGRIATVTIPYTPPVVVVAASTLPPGPVEETGGNIGIVFDATPDPKPVAYVKSYDFRLAEPMP